MPTAAAFMAVAGLFLSGGIASAQSKDAVFYQKYSTPFFVAAGNLGNASFQPGAKVLDFELNDGRKASFATSTLDSILFVKNAGKIAAMPFADEVIAKAFASQNVPGYSEVQEPSYKDFKDGDEFFNDYLENYTVEKTISITFSGNSANIPASLPKNVTIAKNGAHVTAKCAKGHIQFNLSGSTDNGSFTLVDLGEDSKKCHVQLNGVSITNPKGPAINIQSGKAVYLKLAAGKSNTLKDGKTYDIVADQDRKAALFSEGQLIISGTGSLSVVSAGGHGICSDDYIRIRSGAGSISVTSDFDGINAKEKFMMYGGKISINAKGDGIQVRQGHAEIYAGQLFVNSSDNGIKVNYEKPDSAYLDIRGGFQRIETEGTRGHAINVTGRILHTSGAVSMLKSGGLGSKCLKSDSGISISASTIYAWNTAQNLDETDDTAKARAISGSSIEIGKSASVYVCAAKTGIYSTGNLTVNGGETFVTATEREKCLNVKGTVSQSQGLVVIGTQE